LYHTIINIKAYEKLVATNYDSLQFLRVFMSILLYLTVAVPIFAIFVPIFVGVL